jgi:hypothetical protein
MYAMQRANGDWFALSEKGKMCVPVFNSNRDAMQARSLNIQMLHFKPVMLNEQTLNDLLPEKTEAAASFRIISDPTLNLSRGPTLDHIELVLLSRN